jgi:hypothetical protein
MPGVAQVTTSDGAGDGYGLERNPETGLLFVVWIAHEEPGRRSREFSTLEECFAHEAAILFATDGDTEGIASFVQKERD